MVGDLPKRHACYSRVVSNRLGYVTYVGTLTDFRCKKLFGFELDTDFMPLLEELWDLRLDRCRGLRLALLCDMYLETLCDLCLELLRDLRLELL